MFELTLMAAGLVMLFTIFDYVLYFIIKPSAVGRILIGLAMLAALFYIFSSPYAKDIIFPLARLVKEDLANETKTERTLDFIGFTTVVFLSYILHWTLYARATGRPDSYGLTVGALVGLFALA
jgi:hypothetical protein